MGNVLFKISVDTSQFFVKHAAGKSVQNATCECSNEHSASTKMIYNNSKIGIRIITDDKGQYTH